MDEILAGAGILTALTRISDPSITRQLVAI